MASTYEIVGEALRVQTLLSMPPEDRTPEETDELNFKLALLETDFAEKADSIAKVIKNLSAEADAYKAEADRLTKLHKSRENAIERLKDLMLYAMIATNTPKVGTSIGCWSLRKNAPSVEIADTVNVSDLPAEFLRIKEPEANKTAMLKAFKEGRELPIGCAVVQKDSVRFG